MTKSKTKRTPLPKPRTDISTQVHLVSRCLLDELIEDSKHWGLQEEYGNGKNVDNAEKSFKASVRAMEQQIIRMQGTIKRLRAQRLKVQQFLGKTRGQNEFGPIPKRGG